MCTDDVENTFSPTGEVFDAEGPLMGDPFSSQVAFLTNNSRCLDEVATTLRYHHYYIWKSQTIREGGTESNGSST
jgi:hypothetical protein